MAGQLRLGQLNIIQQCAGSSDSGRMIIHFQTKSAQVLAAEIARNQVKTTVRIKLPIMQPRNICLWQTDIEGGFIIRHKDFCRLQTCQLVNQLVRSRHSDLKLAALQRCPSNPQTFFSYANCCNSVCFLIFQQSRIRQGSRCNNPYNLSFHRSFTCADFAHLLANRHTFSQLYQARQILFRRMIRHTCHLNCLAVHLTASRQSNVQQLGRFHRVVKKQLIKIAHAVKNQFIQMIGFNTQILLYHRRNGGFAHFQTALY